MFEGYIFKAILYIMDNREKSSTTSIVLSPLFLLYHCILGWIRFIISFITIQFKEYATIQKVQSPSIKYTNNHETQQRPLRYFNKQMLLCYGLYLGAQHNLIVDF